MYIFRIQISDFDSITLTTYQHFFIFDVFTKRHCNVFNNLYNKVPDGKTTMNERDLEIALTNLNEDPTQIIVTLSNIGVLKEYKAYSKTKTNNKDKRYHIPDLYLYGFKFKRKGTR